MKSLEDRLGLHEDIKIIYVVDGYEAEMLTDDGQTHVACGRGETIRAALDDLEKRLDQLAPRG